MIDVKPPIIQPREQHITPFLKNFTEIVIGAGTSCFKVTEQGQWMGAEKFENAPFKVDMEGNLTARNVSLIDSDLIIYSGGIPSVVIQA